MAMRGELAAGVLITIRFAADLDHRRQARVKHAAKIELLVLPPVAMITALRARRFIVGFVLSILPSERKLFSGVVDPGMMRGVYSRRDADHCAPSFRPVRLTDQLVIL